MPQIDLDPHGHGPRRAVAAGLVMGAVGLAVSFQLKIGDTDPGAPELRPDSRYNRDNAFITQHYGASSDVFAVMVQTPPGGCSASMDELLSSTGAPSLVFTPGSSCAGPEAAAGPWA